MSAIMTASVVFAAVNVLLGLLVGVVYWRNHREIRSPFTLGLMLFALFIVVHNAVVVYHFATMMTVAGGASETFALVESLLQTSALAALAVATLR